MLAAALAGIMPGAAAASSRAAARAGGGWAVQATPDSTGASRILFSVSCFSARACAAVGSQSKGTRSGPLAGHWNGSRWTIKPLRAANAALTGVSCPALRECIAVGGGVSNLAERWNGTRWTVQPTPNPADAAVHGTQIALAAVACPKVTFCLAVGGYLDHNRRQRQQALSWNGRSWRLVRGLPEPFSTGTALAAVSCSARTACTAVGNYSTAHAASQGFAERWNGRSWAIQAMPRLHGQDFIIAGVSCPSARFCLAVGSSLTASTSFEVTERWNGTAWSASQAATPPAQAGGPGGSLAAVSCHSARLCVAVGTLNTARGSTRTLAERWNGTAWAVQHTPDPSREASALASVSCPTARTCTAVGDALFGVRIRALAERNTGE